MLIDTHAHLYWESFQDNLDETIQRSIDAGVTTIINVGVNVELSRKALRLAQDELANIPELTAYSTIGIHPHDSINYMAYSDVSIHKDIIKLEHIYQSSISKVVAVGECGLDYFFNHPALLKSPQGKPISIEAAKDLQKQLFKNQIDLAKRLDLPLLAHCRDDRSKNPENCEAWDEVLTMIGDHPTILHCYSGLIKTTQQILKMPNTLISFAATITYPKNEYLREAAKLLPLDKIVLETDCPFLPPQSKRGQRNEPANILEIAQTIADLKGISLDEVCDQTTKNAKEILRLNPGHRRLRLEEVT